MKYLHYEVETRARQRIVVHLHGTEANVCVMDADNFQKYESGDQFSYFGGHFKRSPAIIAPPSGKWHVTIDLGGGAGTVQASLSVM